MVTPSVSRVPEIEPLALKAILDRGEKIVLLDVREPEEHSLVSIPGSKLIPLMELEDRLSEIREICFTSERVVIYCRSGKRSAMAIDRLLSEEIGAVLLNLRGGINAYALEADRSLSPY